MLCSAKGLICQANGVQTAVADIADYKTSCHRLLNSPVVPSLRLVSE